MKSTLHDILNFLNISFQKKLFHTSHPSPFPWTFPIPSICSTIFYLSKSNQPAAMLKATFLSPFLHNESVPVNTDGWRQCMCHLPRSQPRALLSHHGLEPHGGNHRCINSLLTDFNPWSEPIICYLLRLTQGLSSSTSPSVKERVGFHSKSFSAVFTVAEKGTLPVGHLPMSGSPAMKRLTGSKQISSHISSSSFHPSALRQGYLHSTSYSHAQRFKLYWRCAVLDIILPFDKLQHILAELYFFNTGSLIAFLQEIKLFSAI